MISKGCAPGAQHSCGRSRLAVRTLNLARAPCSAQNRASCWGHHACRAKLRGPQGSLGAEASARPAQAARCLLQSLCTSQKHKNGCSAEQLLSCSWPRREEKPLVLSSGLPVLPQHFVRGLRPSLLCCCVCFVEAAKENKLFCPMMQIASVGVNTETTVCDLLPPTFKSCFFL